MGPQPTLINGGKLYIQCRKLHTALHVVMAQKYAVLQSL